MKFVDEAKISIYAGNGGHGCLSFLREKFRPKGGPDGGDGGRGGDVVLIPDNGLNTLADFRYTRKFRAKNGTSGAGKDKSGRAGDDKIIRMPAGTVVSDDLTGEVIVDMSTIRDRFVIARGGDGGLGNARFKSSTNQAPRRTTDGKPGVELNLRLELRVLADVGLLGMPNAGKSTLLRAISHARPRVADYPFTTLYPELGVVDLGDGEGFVAADIPGLIEGAARGAGLGIRFLKHLRRTRLLLHIVDISGFDPDQEPVASIRTIQAELSAFGHDLDRLPQWLVFNKCDYLTDQAAKTIGEEIVREIGWDAPYFWISAINGEGCRKITQEVRDWLFAQRGSETQVDRTIE